jgi:hypothetical protein
VCVGTEASINQCILGARKPLGKVLTQDIIGQNCSGGTEEGRIVRVVLKSAF